TRPENAPAPRGTVLVLGPQSFLDALPLWTSWKRNQGWTVILSPLSALAKKQDVLEAIHKTFDGYLDQATDDRPAGHVLLVGDCASGEPEAVEANRVPCGKRSSAFLGDLPSDFDYAMPTATHQPRLAVGRWPVHSADEARLLAARTTQREHTPPAAQTVLRNRLHFIAGAPGYSPELDKLIEDFAFAIITKAVPQEWDLRVLYTAPSSEYSTGTPAGDRGAAIALLEAGAFATVICSHGSITAISGRKFDKLLENQQMIDLGGAFSATHLFIFTCSSGNFANTPVRSPTTGQVVAVTNPDQASLAEVTLLNPHGPPLVVAASSISHPLFNKYFCDLLIDAVLKHNPPDWGNAWYCVQRRFAVYRDKELEAVLKNVEKLGDLDVAALDHLYMYNYLGDPTLEFLPLELNLPFQADRQSDPGGDSGSVRVFGRLSDGVDGVAEISVVVHRDEIAKKRPKIDPDHVADFPALAGERYRLTTDKTIDSVETPVRHGEFTQVFRLSGTDWLRARQIRVVLHLKNGLTRAGVVELPDRLAASETPAPAPALPAPASETAPKPVPLPEHTP
ncbi:MAG TPA: C25 family cysteine peptidase, partial [Planctomycetota bacterium]|nr:C25 family cysteine peptidase [Planctomycetota bacterium]